MSVSGRNCCSQDFRVQGKSRLGECLRVKARAGVEVESKHRDLHRGRGRNAVPQGGERRLKRSWNWGGLSNLEGRPLRGPPAHLGPLGPPQRVKCEPPMDTACCGSGPGWLLLPSPAGPSGSCGQWMPVFVDTTMAFVHSFPKHQLEDAGRGQGTACGDMAVEK